MKCAHPSKVPRECAHGVCIHCSAPQRLHIRARLLTAGVAIAVYGLVGTFGAARYGLATEGDLLVNTWLGGRAEGILDAVLVAYLAISIPPIQVSLGTLPVFH